jgi:hypothetical protein
MILSPSLFSSAGLFKRARPTHKSAQGFVCRMSIYSFSGILSRGKLHCLKLSSSLLAD